MKPKKRKTSADYPQFQFRLSKEDKDEVQKRIDELYDSYNTALNSDFKNIKKGEIVLEALKLGLSALEKNKN